MPLKCTFIIYILLLGSANARNNRGCSTEQPASCASRMRYCDVNRQCVPHNWCIDGAIKPRLISSAASNLLQTIKANDAHCGLRSFRKCRSCQTCCKIRDDSTTTATTTTTTTTTTSTTTPYSTSTPASSSTTATTSSTTALPTSTTSMTTTTTSTSTPSTTTSTTATTTTSTTTAIPTIMPTSTITTTPLTSTTTTPTPYLGCGYSSLSSTTLTSNADAKANLGEFPWMVAIAKQQRRNKKLSLRFLGAGSLLAPNAVLTAAHKLHKEPREMLLIRAGVLEIENRLSATADRAVLEIVLHSEFNDYLENDMAILILEKPYEWCQTVQPICLPPPNVSFDNERCLAAGWGRGSFGVPAALPMQLKKIDLPIISNAACEHNLQQTGAGRFFELHESFLCAGGEADKDTCTGDGGSALVCLIAGSTNRYHVAGIVVKGFECKVKDVPGLYVNVSRATEWILKTLRNKGVDLSFSRA